MLLQYVSLSTSIRWIFCDRTGQPDPLNSPSGNHPAVPVHYQEPADLRSCPLQGIRAGSVSRGYLQVMLGYYFVVAAILALAGPVLLLKKKARAGLAQKLGIIPPPMRAQIFNQQFCVKDVSSGLKRTPTPSRVWFHAVSVGEFNAVFPLIEEFHRRHRHVSIFISTTTATGQEQARKKAGGFATVFYFPFDLPFALNSWIDTIVPDAVVIVETEIWPGFLSQCSDRDIPVFLINGRLSPRSFKGYMRWRWFFRPSLQMFTALAVQSFSEASRYEKLSGTAQNIAVCGNIKIDGIKAIPENEILELRQMLNLGASDPVLVAGSTHEGEEVALLQCPAVRKGLVKLILVPRHPERFNRVASIIESNGYHVRRFSRTERFTENADVYLLDTIGQLSRFYSIASMAFVGGTIAPIGGHSLAEPCAYSIPVVCGPHTHKTRDIATSMLEQKALIQVSGKEALHAQLEHLALSPAARREAGSAGNRWLHENQGALARTLEFLESHMNRQQQTLKDNQVLVGQSTK